ncbi:hypothetical protein EDD21DRAFT_429793 [Dissophora ornata]|nr:hypothetical protein BGZ58_010341 [Dissophora ornata]KAI8601170.1 hypothetical protein EDD21DRAFT_429793 [Dissophora ornata]
MAGFLSGNLGGNSTKAVLRSKTGVCAGFFNLFLASADQQQLGVTQVPGVTRGYDVEIGGSSLGGSHAWNAVATKGGCLYINSTWGTEVDDLSSAVGKKFSSHYFLTRPEHLI